MGSYSWDNPCCVQYHNGRPLSVALTEPCQCDGGPSACGQSDFTTHHRPRSHSSGRRFQRESFSVFNPNVQYSSFCHFPPFSRRTMDWSSARDMLVERFETVTVEEERCRPQRCCNYVCTSAPIVRQVKIRSRPSSCVNLHKEKAAEENQWTKVVDEVREEHHDWHYNITVPIEKASSFDHSAAASIINELRIPIASKSTGRPLTRDVGTLANFSKEITTKKPIRPLSISETQVLDRYEKIEKIRRDSITDTGSFSYTVCQRPANRISDEDDSYDEKQAKRFSKKAQRKDFVQRMHAKNGTTSSISNALNIYSDRGKHQMIVRPTAKPREALVDAPSIVAPPGESEPSTPIAIETNFRSRSYYQPY